MMMKNLIIKLPYRDLTDAEGFFDCDDFIETINDKTVARKRIALPINNTSTLNPFASSFFLNAKIKALRIMNNKAMGNQGFLFFIFAFGSFPHDLVENTSKGEQR